ncbi:YitT family protein [Vibrio hippocampi]|uniref:YitT family protein n=1 Tax=Vibrio hippocampi TaxID=654686 RepID=A0ABM8ZLU4_9VIBR|nr:YitT family protein [Vibrio hippocampi]CAH0528896.1 hypothetical protein VHP8226_02924 [Vibrio hippocampi]
MDKDHTVKENLLALTVGSALVSLGVIIFNHVGLLTGGTAGLAIFITKVTSFSFGQVFFALNLPFYFLSITRMGWQFTLNTLIAVSIVSFAVDHLYHAIQFAHLDIVYAALIGGALIGMGVLVIFRHKMSLGGFNILALFIQERYGISAGKIQLALDSSIVVLSLFIVDISIVALSILGAIATNIILAMNHKPGRYQPIPRS